jgi:large subunit ribosomal protein L22
MAEVTAKLNRLDISPRKVRSVIRIISGLPVGDAEAQLLFRKERSARPILKLLKSAVANARNKGISTDSLYVKAIWADEGQVLKRWVPRARGMATPLHKKFSHVTIVLSEGSVKKSKFTISLPSASTNSKKDGVTSKKKASTAKKKSTKKTEEKVEAKEKKTPKKAIKATGKTESSGASKTESPVTKVFRRKSV